MYLERQHEFEGSSRESYHLTYCPHAEADHMGVSDSYSNPDPAEEIPAPDRQESRENWNPVVSMTLTMRATD